MSTCDGKGRLRQVTESNWVYGAWSLNATIRYVYDGMRVIQERDANGTPTAAYTRGRDLSGSFEGAGGIGGLLARSSSYSAGSWGAHSMYHADGNGNITYLVSNASAKTAEYRSDPFGRTTYSSGSLASANAFRFSSKLWHEKTGFYYYGYRFYDPLTQRWSNRDPIQEPGFESRRVALEVDETRKFLYMIDAKAVVGKRANPYAYVNEDPLNQADSLGLQSLPPGWHGPGRPYDPSSNPFCGPPPRCSRSVCSAGCAAAAAAINIWVCDFLKLPKPKAFCKTAVAAGAIACGLACQLCPDP